MKELFEHEGITIGIMDENNYVVFDKRKPIYGKDRQGEKTVTYKYSYFSQMKHCIREASRRVSDEAASTLAQWLESYARVSELAQMG